MVETINLIKSNNPMLFYGMVFIVGACIGSFLNVCIYRIPRGESVVYPRSRCPHCGRAIRWYDNIPIISWFILRGKCRDCNGKISTRYTLIEMLTGLMFILCWYSLEPKVAIVGMVFISIIIIGTLIDIDHLMIPNRFTVGGMILGMILSFFVPEIQLDLEASGHLFRRINALGLAGFGVIVGSGVLLWISVCSELIFKRETIGFGDIKLMGCIGAFCGWKGAVFAIFGGSVIGSLVLVPLMLMGLLRNREDGATHMIVPFGPWLGIGAVIYFIGFKEYVDGYFEMVKQIFF